VSSRFSPQNPAVALVVAMGANRGIGLDGGLPWHLRSDMKFFRKVTMGKPILMGRRTFMSLPRILDGRLNIVLSRNGDFQAPGGVVVAGNLDAGLEAGRAECAKTGADEIMVIGGEDVFREILPQTDRIYLTEVYAVPEADTFFPALEEGNWCETFREAHEAGLYDDHDFSFVILDRVAAPSL
jgi:dihydrofolate reductase